MSEQRPTTPLSDEQTKALDDLFPDGHQAPHLSPSAGTGPMLEHIRNIAMKFVAPLFVLAALGFGVYSNPMLLDAPVKALAGLASPLTEDNWRSAAFPEQYRAIVKATDYFKVVCEHDGLKPSECAQRIGFYQEQFDLINRATPSMGEY